jgi:hypothetical protein
MNDCKQIFWEQGEERVIEEMIVKNKHTKKSKQKLK